MAEQKDLLLERLAEFDTSNKALRRLIRSQQSHEVRRGGGVVCVCVGGGGDGESIQRFSWLAGRIDDVVSSIILFKHCDTLTTVL